MFLISWFFYLFLLCSISLLVKYDFILILRYEAWVNAIKASSFIENFPQISTKPIAFQSAVLYQSFFSETGLENSREIPAKSAVFSANLSLKIPRNLTFFPRPTRSPVIIILLPFFPRYLTLYHLSPTLKKKHITLCFWQNKGCVAYHLHEECSQKYQVANVHVITKIVTFVSQHINVTEYKIFREKCAWAVWHVD